MNVRARGEKKGKERKKGKKRECLEIGKEGKGEKRGKEKEGKSWKSREPILDRKKEWDEKKEREDVGRGRGRKGNG